MTGVPLGPGGWFYEQGHRICVNGLGTKATKTILQAAFGEFGHIIKIETPRSGTAAYISFQDRLDADDAIKSMDGERIDGQRVTVSRAGDRPPPGAGLKEGSVVDRHREVLTTTNFEREEKRTAQYLDSKGWDKRLGSKQHKSVPSQSSRVAEVAVVVVDPARNATAAKVYVAKVQAAIKAAVDLVIDDGDACLFAGRQRHLHCLRVASARRGKDRVSLTAVTT
eukprot:CAMPEP_0194515684 /NCGR_PEP_ID=MMETSP0253-20130528/48427_1 /TAXON_ID=2966 /ORGANISM="Noctiluca scintillans" /LENGTH=223 /DNA_ID=CAMNT_0039359457 /DNA_START=146 /DNA_END=818 /DNA_ORIENTATION=-